MESDGDFPFRKLRFYKYLTLEVLMNIDHFDACYFMFKINREARKFILNNYIAVRNGYINEGLIDFVFNNLP